VLSYKIKENLQTEYKYWNILKFKFLLFYASKGYYVEFGFINIFPVLSKRNKYETVWTVKNVKTFLNYIFTGNVLITHDSRHREGIQLENHLT
jgi:hypothetical protein